MPAFADKTRLAIATESVWGQSPGSGFAFLPLTSENLRPEYSRIRPQSLSAVKRVAPVVTESVASGEIEGIASAELLDTLLPFVMMSTSSDELSDYLQEFITDSSGYNSILDSTTDIRPGDFVWIALTRQENSVSPGFYPVIKHGSFLKISGFSPFLYHSYLVRRYCRLLSAGEGLTSFSLLRNFGASTEWTRFTGMCIERLVIDANQGSLATVTASLIGKQMTEGLTESAGAATATAAPVSAPLSLAPSEHAFRITGAGGTRGHNDLVLTGLRVVIERTGMAPRHVLGREAASLITPGRLSVYGHLEMLISDGDLLANLLDQDALAISVNLADAGMVKGAAFSMGRVKITSVESLPRGSDDLLAARFAFTAEHDDGDEAIRFSLQPNDRIGGTT